MAIINLKIIYWYTMLWTWNENVWYLCNTINNIFCTYFNLPIKNCFMPPGAFKYIFSSSIFYLAPCIFTHRRNTKIIERVWGKHIQGFFFFFLHSPGKYITKMYFSTSTRLYIYIYILCLLIRLNWRHPDRKSSQLLLLPSLFLHLLYKAMFCSWV